MDEHRSNKYVTLICRVHFHACVSHPHAGLRMFNHFSISGCATREEDICWSCAQRFHRLEKRKKNNKDLKKMCFVKNGKRDIGQLVKQVGNLKAGCLE